MRRPMRICRRRPGGAAKSRHLAALRNYSASRRSNNERDGSSSSEDCQYQPFGFGRPMTFDGFRLHSQGWQRGSK